MRNPREKPERERERERESIRVWEGVDLDRIVLIEYREKLMTMDVMEKAIRATLRGEGKTI